MPTSGGLLLVLHWHLGCFLDLLQHLLLSIAVLLALPAVPVDEDD